MVYEFGNDPAAGHPFPTGYAFAWSSADCSDWR